jgi:hypothetical protein
MQQLDEKAKQERAEFTALLGAQVCLEGVPYGTLNTNTQQYPIVEGCQTLHERPMHTKLPASFKQQVTPHKIKCLLEIHKHNIQHPPPCTALVNQVLHGEQCINGAMIGSEATLGGCSQRVALHNTLKPLKHNPVPYLGDHL